MGADSGKPKIDLSAFAKVKLGPGVIGKTTYVMCFLIVAVAVIGGSLAFSGFGYLAFTLCVMLFGAVVWYIIHSFKYAEKNPAIALLEGANLIAWRKMEMSAKQKEIVGPASEPNVSPPLLPGASDNNG